MPTFRKLTPEEIQDIEWAKSGIRKAIAATYDNYMRDFAAGDYGEATLEPSEKRMTVMSRLKAAAERHDPPLKLVFRRTNDPDLLRFMVLARDDSTSGAEGDDGLANYDAGQVAQVLAEKPVSSDSAPKKRAGRATEASTESSNGTGKKKGPGRPRKQPV